MAAYIFDFDGTIADSFPIACKILEQHAKDLGCRQFTTSELLMLKELHARDLLKQLGVSFWRIAPFVRKLRKLTKKYVNEIEIFPQWPQILKTAHENQHQLGIISSNARETIEFILTKNNIMQYFNFIVSENSLFGKKQCLKKLIKQKNLLPETTFYIGDEVRDIEAAHAAKINSIAVSWGFNSSARLQQASPGLLINSLEELSQVLCDF